MNAAADLNLLPKLDKWDPKRVEGLSGTARLASNEKAKRILGITALRTIPDTLRDTLDDFRARGWLQAWEA